MLLEILLALIGVVSGGGLVKLYQALTGNSQSLRAELRSEIKTLNERLDTVEDESAKHRNRSLQWQARAFEWFQKLRLSKLRSYQTMVMHGVDAEVAKEILHEDESDAWTDIVED